MQRRRMEFKFPNLSKKFKDYNKKWFANVVLGNGVECLSPSAVYFLEVSLIFTAIKAV